MQANGKDKAVGAAAFSLAVTVFVYYTTWALIMVSIQYITLQNPHEDDRLTRNWS
jgi:hypothetical protein